ncbi:MAG: DUF547 domain-containing protein, partial [Chitinophagales bacterium]
SSYIEDFANFEKKELKKELITESEKKAFWLNIYNAYIQIKAKENPSMLADSRNDFFGKKWINIAGKEMSFDLIEHGIIRSSKIKWSLGYIDKWFPSKFEQQFRLDSVDYRIHFALNCGAKGCPPIAFYTPENLEEQLNTATASFLQLETNYNVAENEVTVSKIMQWFNGDFGGKVGIKSILEQYEITPENSNPKIIYQDYDWTIALQNYVK